MDNSSATPNGGSVSTEKKTRGKYAVKDASTYPMVSFKWTDGTVSDVDVETFSEDDRKAAILHGFSQKLGDSYANSKTLDDAKERFQNQLEHIKANGFRTRMEGDNEEPIELLAQAVVATLQEDGKSPEYDKIFEQIKAADRKTRNMWRNVDRVAFHLANLRKHTEKPTLAAFGY